MSPADPGPRRAAQAGINTGAGRTLVAGYGMFALAATGRSAVQLLTDPGKAPVAYSLSALAAAIYALAATCLIIGDRVRTIAIVACTVELAGVLVVGALSYVATELFPDRTVWSHFGQGYAYLPLALPVIGLWWLSTAARAHQRREPP